MLWYLDPNHQPEGTLAWLEPRPGVPWYHVRGQRADDLGRLARRVLGRAIGLVFGGASSRGVAHLGILDAMRERGLGPDLIAGASSGAGFGATVATLRSRDALMEGCVIVATEFRARLSAVGPPRRATSPSGSTTSIPSTWSDVTPYFRQCGPPEFSATFPPIVHAVWLEGSGA